MTAVSDEPRIQFPTEPEYVPVKVRFVCSHWTVKRGQPELCNAVLWVGWWTPGMASIGIKCKCGKTTTFE